MDNSWHSNVKEAVTIWFTGKPLVDKPPEGSNKQKTIETIPSKILTLWLKCVYGSLREDKGDHKVQEKQPNQNSLQPVKFDDPPEVSFSNSQLALGWYVPATHKLFINQDWYPVKDVESKFKSLKPNNINIFDLDPILKKLFASGPNFAGTAVHEASHAWRNDSHEGAHADIVLKIGQDIPKTYTFDAAASLVYNLAKMSGCLSNFIRERDAHGLSK